MHPTRNSTPHWMNGIDHRLYSIDDFIRQHRANHISNGAGKLILNHIHTALIKWYNSVHGLGNYGIHRLFTYNEWRAMLFAWRQASDYYRFSEPYSYCTGGFNCKQRKVESKEVSKKRWVRNLKGDGRLESINQI